MKLMAMLRCWWRAMVHGERVRDEVSEELAFHLEARAEELQRGGMTGADARRQARVEMGWPEKQGERYREAVGLRWVDELGGDLRYAWRMLMRSKGFTAVAVGSLALGIGANTIIFSLAKGVLLDRLAVPHPDQLRFLSMLNGDRSPVQAAWGDTDNKGNKVEMLQFSYPIYQALQQQNREHPVLQDLFAFKFLNPGDRLTATFNGRAEVVSAQMVSGNFYEQLGVRPQLGRTIQPADDGAAGAGNVVVLSDGVWSRMFGRSPDVIGKTIQLNLIPMTIVGVNPPGFTGAASVQLEPDVFFSLSMQPVLHPMGQAGHASLLDDKNLSWVQVMARVRPDVSVETADAAMQTWLEQDIRATMKLEKDAEMPKLSLSDGSRGMSEANRDYSMQVYVLATLTGFVLLLACANLANLLLARSATRQREIAVRLALGASRGRVLRQVLTESLLLSLLGGAAGLTLGYLGRNIIPHMYNAPWTGGVLRGDFDAAIFAFTAMVSVLTGIFFGMAPAWQAMRTPVNTGLKDAAASATRRRKGMTGRSLVVLQVALSMLLVVGAGLFGTTLRNLYSEKLGFSAEHLFLFELRAPESRYPAPKDVALHERLAERLTRVPGIESLSLSSVPEVAGGGWDDYFEPTDQPERKKIAVMMNNVGSSFFGTYRIPVLFGREFSSADTNTSKLVAVVNQALVRKFWPHASPLGKIFKTGPHDKPQIVEVVGVVGDAKYDNLDRVPPATVYFPYVQANDATQMTYVVKSSMSAAVMTHLIREAIAEVDRDLPMRDVRTQQAQIDATVSQQRTFAVLSGAFGVLALVLACIGIYGLMAYDVARRTSEIGIRMALGARASQMMGMVLREASWMAVAGIAAGLGGALMLAKYVKSMLYGLTPNDPWILGGAGMLLFVVALAAGLGPARRAANVEPMEALRHE
jgi:predicted permease